MRRWRLREPGTRAGLPPLCYSRHLCRLFRARWSRQGAIGLTTAIQLQRAGARVTIYAKDHPPSVRSSWATGLYTPDSRIALEEHATPEFKQTWAKAARQTYETFQSFLGVAGTPVEYIDNYGVSDEQGPRQRNEPDGKPKFAEL